MSSLVVSIMATALIVSNSLHVKTTEMDNSTNTMKKESSENSSHFQLDITTTLYLTDGNHNTTADRANVTEPTVKTKINKDNSAQLLLDKIEHVKNFYVLPPVCLIGIVGNSLVASILYNKRGNNSSFIYMFVLLMADILSLVSDLLTPLSYLLDLSAIESLERNALSLRYYNEAWVSFVLRVTSINILCVLSVERFIAIKFPLHLKRTWTVRYPIVFILISILMALFSNWFQLFHFKYDDVQIKGSNNTVYKKVYTDFYASNKEDIDKVVIFMKFFSGPLQILFFSVMNVLIVYGIHQNTKSLKMIESTRNRPTNVQVKLAKIFILLSVLNAAAFLPNSIMPIIARLFPSLGINIKDPSTKLILQSFKFCRVLNSANDFIIFFAMSKETRQDLKNSSIFRKLQINRKSANTSSNGKDRYVKT